MSRPRRGDALWVACHCEVFPQPNGGHHVDELVFFVAPSRKRLLRLIRAVRVEKGTWYRVTRVAYDDTDGEVGPWRYYSRKGKAIAQPDVDRGLRKALERARRDLGETVAQLDAARRDGASAEEIGNLERSLRAQRELLEGR